MFLGEARREEEGVSAFVVQCALLYLIRALMGGGGEAGCGMSAEGLAVLATQGVAHCPSLSELNLDGKTGVCVCARACKRDRAPWFRMREGASRELKHTCFLAVCASLCVSSWCI